MIVAACLDVLSRNSSVLPCRLYVIVVPLSCLLLVQHAGLLLHELDGLQHYAAYAVFSTLLVIMFASFASHLHLFCLGALVHCHEAGQL